MKERKRAVFILWVLILAVGVLCTGPAMADDAEKIEKLERLIMEQQRQMESMQRQLNELKRTVGKVETKAEEAGPVAEEVKTAVKEPPVEKVVTSGEERVKLAISGQVNRAVNLVDDGEKTKAYFVDNDASNSRVRFVGTAKATDDLTLGTRIEVAIAPNESSQVSQNDQESGDFFDERYAEVYLQSKRFGKLYLGKGDTASNNTAEVDLSRTSVVQYAGIADIAGGMLFRQKNDNVLTNITVSDAFSDFDGLSRKSRVRYDTPVFYGFNLAGSAVSDGRYDASVWWGAQGYGFQAAAAAGIADPNQENTNYQYDGSFSILHVPTGLNFTFSGGTKVTDNKVDPYNLYWKLGWQANFFSVGRTAFGVDYTLSKNLPTENDDGYSFGAAIVQGFENYGIETYLQYRLYSLDTEPSVYDMNVLSLGARVKF